nr:phosphatase PAP2 family protein [Marivita sp. GX14005]
MKPAIDRLPQSWLLVGLILVSALAWGFIELADEVAEGATHRYDAYLMRALLDITGVAAGTSSPLMGEIMRDTTALGGIAVLGFVVIAVSGFLWLAGKRRSTVFLLISVATGLAMSQWFKGLFDRPRPDFITHGSYVHTASFPSGHSLMAALVYMTLAVMLARSLKQRAAKVYVTALAILLALSVGFSRIWLGVHWPTDVLAGWMLGTGWALACAVLAGWLDRRGVIEPEEGAPPAR